MPFGETPFTSTILPIPVTRLGAHPNVVMAVLAGRGGPITVEHAGGGGAGGGFLGRAGGVFHGPVRWGGGVVFPHGPTFSFPSPPGRAVERKFITTGPPGCR